MPELFANVKIEDIEYACATCLKKFRASQGVCPHCAAQQSVHLTAVYVGVISFLAGGLMGWLIAYTQIGGR